MSKKLTYGGTVSEKISGPSGQPQTLPKLKTCPFCGMRAMSAIHENGRFMVLCDDDWCPVQPESGDFLTREGAANAWNTRK
jgi:restriction alleviation protein Lar